MALFFLNYDLRKRRNCEDLYAELKRFNAVRILESLWCFNRYQIKAEGLRVKGGAKPWRGAGGGIS